MSEHEFTTDPLALDLQYHQIDGVWAQTIDAYKLHQGLEITTRFDLWIARRIAEYSFREGSDFCTILCKTSGRPKSIYMLTLDMAKELAMVERSPQGRKVRQYFIACENAVKSIHGALVKIVEQYDARLRVLEEALQAKQAPDALTPKGQLPAPTPRMREHAEVSRHLAAAWALLRDSGECLTNREIAERTGIAPRTARAHTRYLLQIGMLDLHETFPRHLYVLAAQAQNRNSGVYRRLNTLTEIIQARVQY